MSTFAEAATPTCRAEIEKAKAILSQRRGGAAAPSHKPSLPVTCWRESPQLLREMVAAVAGVPHEVTKKIDRDLTEEEKAKLRIARDKMRARLNALVAL